MVMDRCCCGCSLRLGTILIGLYHLVIYTPCLLMVVKYGGDEEFRNEIYRVSASDDKGRMPEEQMKEVGEALYQSLFIMLIASLVLNAILIFGALMRVWLFFIPWVIEHLVSLAVLVFFLVANLVAKFGDMKVRSVTVGATAVHTLLSVYYIVVIINTAIEFRRNAKIQKQGGAIFNSGMNLNQSQPLTPLVPVGYKSKKH